MHNDKIFDIIPKDEALEAWSQVNFGETAKPMPTITRLVIQRALGYHVGSGAHFLLTELGLTDSDGKVTKKGEAYLFAIPNEFK